MEPTAAAHLPLKEVAGTERPIRVHEPCSISGLQPCRDRLRPYSPSLRTFASHEQWAMSPPVWFSNQRSSQASVDGNNSYLLRPRNISGFSKTQPKMLCINFVHLSPKDERLPQSSWAAGRCCQWVSCFTALA